MSLRAAFHEMFPIDRVPRGQRRLTTRFPGASVSCTLHSDTEPISLSVLAKRVNHCTVVLEVELNLNICGTAFIRHSDHRLGLKLDAP